MLPKKNRASKRDLDNLFKSKVFLSSDFFSFKYAVAGKKAPKISFVVPKSVAKLATDRNSLRRVGYLAVSPYFKNLPIGLVGVFFFKKSEKSLSKIQNEVEKILNKIN